MENATLTAKPPISEAGSLHTNSKQPYDFTALINKMKGDSFKGCDDLNAMVLMKSPYKQVVLATIHEGVEIKSFQADESVTFQIIEGKLKFHTRKESVTLEKNQWLTLHEKIKYSLTSKEETVFVLTIANCSLPPDEN